VRCKKRDELLEQYTFAVKRFSKMVLSIKPQHPKISFAAQFRQGEELRHACDMARHALEEHQAEHGC
jgi:hypothetical protein